MKVAGNITRKESYTVASAFPVKVAINRELIESIITDRIISPIHIQLNPTNECNLNCEFCSCANRNKTELLPIVEAEKLINRFALLGTKAVTITGGGEPLLYPNIDRLLLLFHRKYIHIGLVTNGTQFQKVHPEILDLVTWCRISHSDKRQFNNSYEAYLDGVVGNAPDVDWAFSIVVSGEDDKNLMRNVMNAVNFANNHHFTHVRIVPDLYNTNEIDLNIYREYLSSKINDEIVIYQERNNATAGGDCFICYLKPYIDATGMIYTCCGAQYALPAPDKQRYMPDELCLGTIDEFTERLKNSFSPFDGSICETCYYMNYNGLLDSMVKNVDHMEFV